MQAGVPSACLLPAVLPGEVQQKETMSACLGESMVPPRMGKASALSVHSILFGEMDLGAGCAWAGKAIRQQAKTAGKRTWHGGEGQAAQAWQPSLQRQAGRHLSPGSLGRFPAAGAAGSQFTKNKMQQHSNTPGCSWEVRQVGEIVHLGKAHPTVCLGRCLGNVKVGVCYVGHVKVNPPCAYAGR